MNRTPLIAFGVVVVVVGVAIALLLTGGGGRNGADDPSGDVRVTKGSSAPRRLEIVDIRAASIASDGSDLLFEVDMEDVVPRELPTEVLSWRWEIYEAGQMTWLVSAGVDLEPNASVVSTQTDYQVSTVNDTLPGSIERDGSTLVVRIEAAEIDGFPTEFDWLVKSSLDGDRTKATSALGEDRAPDDGYLRVEG